MIGKEINYSIKKKLCKDYYNSTIKKMKKTKMKR